MDDSRRAFGEESGGAVRSSWPKRRTWIGYAAAGWTLLYGVLGLHWARDGAEFPFGRDSDPDADAAESIMAGVRAKTAAPVISGS
jgi:hypothetical protein